jgi:hypothetical protein
MSLYIDFFVILDQVTYAKEVSYTQVITWLLASLAIFIPVIGILFSYMKGRFTEATKDRAVIKTDTTEIKIAIAEIKAIMSMTKAVELGTTQEAILAQAKNQTKEKP